MDHPSRLLLRLLMASFLLLPPISAYAGSQDGVSWQVLETKYTIIRYQSPEDLKEFDRRIDYSPDAWSFKGLFSGSASRDLEGAVAKKVDALTERVQEILDMRRRMQRIIINLYPNRDQLDDAYERMYKAPCRLRAWYIYEYNSIYINIEDVHEGMLAHEMAHAIVDHYLLVRPPKATAEILARYVDSHLFE
jgi:hypothetical protein